jgi:adenylylsulfate kinase
MMNVGFAIWITGIPASGKSTIARSLISKLRLQDVQIAHLESDVLRKILTPHPSYSREERDWFYRVMVCFGQILIENGANVLFDATGNRRAYREQARSNIDRFCEVFVKCPLDVAIARDPKGIYRKGSEGKTETVPGLQEDYEEPISPDLVLNCESKADHSAGLIIEMLQQRGWI